MMSHHFIFRNFILLGTILCCAALSLVAQNQAPLIDTLHYCTGQMTPVVICNSYTDPDGDPVSITDGYTTFNCSLVFMNDTCIRYTPLPGFLGTDYVYLTVCDNQEPPNCSVSVVIVTVGCVPPVAQNDQLSISNDAVVFNGQIQEVASAYASITLPVAENDDPICNNTLVIPTIIEGPEHGTVQIVDNLQINYTPTDGYVGADEFSYVICNNCPLCDTATVAINVMSSPNSCNYDIYDCTGPFNTLDICPEFCLLNTAQIASLQAEALNGQIDPPNNGCFNYIPDATFSGLDVVTFVACNVMGVCDTTYAFITIDVSCGSYAPTAVDDGVQTLPGMSVSIDPLVNDTDAEGDDFTLSSFTQPYNGQVTQAGDLLLYTPNAGFLGTDLFFYTICDAAGYCDTAIVTIVVAEPCNSGPYEYCTPSFLTPVQVCVEFCALSDFDDVAIVDASTTFNCSINLLNDTCIRYTPLPGFVGTDWVTLIGCSESSGVCDTLIVTINVGCTQPVAQDDNVTTEGQIVSLNVLNNDNELCGYDLSADLLLQPQHGTATLSVGGTLSYNPDDDYSGTDFITYLACNDCSPARCDTALVIITVNGTTPPPPPPPPAAVIAQPDVVQTRFNTNVTIPVLANDISEGALSITSFSVPINGAVATTPMGTIIYVPAPGFSGSDYFYYQVCDAEGNCGQTLVSITVLPAGASPQAPIANNDTASTALNTSVIIPVIWNDNDPENNNLFIVNAVQPQNGTIAPSGNSSISYTPNAGFSGLDIFEYIICDNSSLCDTAEVAVAVGVDYPNAFPIAQNDAAGTPIGTPIQVLILANDSDPESTVLSPTILSLPAHGSVVLNADNTTNYQPNAGFEGLDYFVYMVCDAATPSLCDTAYVTITVGNGNVPPMAQNDFAQIVLNTEVTIPILSNDTDPNGSSANLEVSAINEMPQHGTATLNTNGTITYIPDLDYIGNDSFNYTVCDEGNACDEATVSITITPPPAPLEAQPDVAYVQPDSSIDVNVLSNDEGADIMVTSVLPADNGDVVLNSNGTITYTPNAGFTGIDYFEYQICNLQGQCDQAVVTVYITAINLPPIAVNDVYLTEVDSSLNLYPMNNDSDPEGQTIIVTSVQQPANGTTFVLDDGSIIVYMPNLDFLGIDTFSYTICDSEGLCATALVAIEVGTSQDGNLPPIAVTDQIAGDINESLTIQVMANDSDPNISDILSVTDFTEPQHGTVLFSSNTFVYTPDNGFTGSDYFIYTVCDNGTPMLCDTAFVSINIADIQEPTDIVEQTLEDHDITICIEEYINIFGTIDTILFYDLPVNGSPYYTNSNDCIAYSPDNNFTGTDNFTIGVCSNVGICDTIVILIDVLPQNDLPNAINDSDTTGLNIPIMLNILANDSDPDNEDISIYTLGSPVHGTVSFDADLNIIYTPADGFVGVDSFQYVIIDPLGWTDVATVTILVTDGSVINTEINAVDDNAIVQVGTIFDLTILSNDIYEISSPIGISLADLPKNGTAVLGSDEITYTPDTGFTGYDTLSYIICQSGQCDTAQVFIHVIFDNSEQDNCLPLFAQGFSPNDDGLNDLWLIAGIAECNASSRLLIFNRWGDIIYQANNYDNSRAWNGKINNINSDAPDGTYFFVLTITNVEATEKSFSGSVELRR